MGRLKYKSVVKEVLVHKRRMLYQLLFGEGPDFGWIAMEAEGRELIEPHTPS